MFAAQRYLVVTGIFPIELLEDPIGILGPRFRII